LLNKLRNIYRQPKWQDCNIVAIDTTLFGTIVFPDGNISQEIDAKLNFPYLLYSDAINRRHIRAERMRRIRIGNNVPWYSRFVSLAVGPDTLPQNAHKLFMNKKNATRKDINRLMRCKAHVNRSP
jgi:hypothetical protein